MLKLAFDRKSRVLQIAISGSFASEDMDELDNAVVEFVARHGSVRGIFDYSDVEAIAVPDSRLAERAQQPQVIEQRVVVASRAMRGERARTYASYRREAGQSQAVIVDSLSEAYDFLDLRNPRIRAGRTLVLYFPRICREETMASPLKIEPVDATFGAVVTGFRIPGIDDDDLAARSTPRG